MQMLLLPATHTPPPQPEREITRQELGETIWNETRHFPTFDPNPTIPNDQFTTWEKVIEAGKSYLVGADTPTDIFLRRHTTSMPHWMQTACRFCRQHPDTTVHLRLPRLIYKLYARGEYVEIALPHQDHGGEKDWVTRNDRSRVLVNLD